VRCVEAIRWRCWMTKMSILVAAALDPARVQHLGRWTISPNWLRRVSQRSHCQNPGSWAHCRGRHLERQQSRWRHLPKPPLCRPCVETGCMNRRTTPSVPARCHPGSERASATSGAPPVRCHLRLTLRDPVDERLTCRSCGELVEVALQGVEALARVVRGVKRIPNGCGERSM
jgi:hypothetical protein